MQRKLQCIGGFLASSLVPDQGDYFYNTEAPLRGDIQENDLFSLVERKYRKVSIPHPNVLGHHYYVCETMTDEQAVKFVNEIQAMC